MAVILALQAPIQTCAQSKETPPPKVRCECVPNCNRHRSVQHLLTRQTNFTSIKCWGSSGEFPSDFSMQPELEEFKLFDPMFGLVGEIPESIGELKKLKIFSLLNAPLITGKLPKSISKLHALETFRITSSRLQGGLEPFAASKLPNLKVIHIFDTSLRGEISSQFLENINGAREIILSQNGFYGTLPSSADLANLEVFDVNGNRHMSGHLPRFLWNPSLQYLNVMDTTMCGEMPPEFDGLTRKPAHLPACHVPIPTEPPSPTLSPSSLIPSLSPSSAPTKQPTFNYAVPTSSPSRSPPPTSSFGTPSFSPTFAPTHKQTSIPSPQSRSGSEDEALNNPAAQGSLAGVTALCVITRLVLSR